MQNGYTEKESFSFWKNIFLSAFFFTVTPIVLLTSLFSLISYSNYSASQKRLSHPPVVGTLSGSSGVKVFASLPSTYPSVDGSVTASDARAEIIRQYAKTWGSPLVAYSDLIVATADKYQLDYRLITAIAQQESNLCKFIPPESYNCWGWGIHSQGTLGFDSYQQGIEEVSRGLREEYLNKGLTTISEIMSKYTPLSNGSWAQGVITFMSQME